MSEHTNQHEALLQAVVVGEVTADAEAVVARRRACPRCARRLDALARALAALEADRAEQEELLALAEEQHDAPGEHHVEALLEGAPRERAGAPAGPRRPPWLAGALTALAAAAGVLFFLRPLADQGAGGDAPEEPRLLGGVEESGLTPLEPLGAVDEYGPFRWSVDPSLAREVGYYVVLVRGPEGEEQELGKSRTTEWDPGPLIRELPDRVEWFVEARGLGADDVLARSPVVGASRAD